MRKEVVAVGYIKKNLLDPDCADEIIPFMNPGVKARLVLWPKEGFGPAETVEVECTWEVPFHLLRVSDYHCAATIDGVNYDYKLYSLAWQATKQVSDLGRTKWSVEQEKLRVSTEAQTEADSEIYPDPPKHKAYDVFRYEKD